MLVLTLPPSSALGPLGLFCIPFHAVRLRCCFLSVPGYSVFLCSLLPQSGFPDLLQFGGPGLHSAMPPSAGEPKQPSPPRGIDSVLL